MVLQRNQSKVSNQKDFIFVIKTTYLRNHTKNTLILEIWYAKKHNEMDKLKCIGDYETLNRFNIKKGKEIDNTLTELLKFGIPVCQALTILR